MNEDRLLAHYAQIADAPDAIARLRRFILDLAVRGELVRQDPRDQSALNLLKHIAAEKTRLVTAGQISKEKPLPDLQEAELPFQIPPSWQWVRLETLVHKITDGEHLSPNKTMSGMPLLTAVHVSAEGLTLENPQFVSIENGKKFRVRCDPRRGDILICSRGTIGRCAVVNTDETFCLMGSVILVRLPSECSASYFNAFLSTDRAQEQMRGMSGATAVQALYLKDIRLCPFPVPPLAEQHRIVAKVDELMALCDRLQASREKREAIRDRLGAACFARLNVPHPGTFQADARFALDALPALTARPDQTKQLRRTILNLAARGKLVPQDSNDEPASELLNRIAKEKPHSQKSTLEGSIAPHHTSDGYDARFELPSGWVWASLEQTTQVGTGLTPSKSQSSYYEGGKIPWINSSATNSDVIREANFFVTQLAVKECRLKIYPAGSLVVALYGQGKTRGQVAELGLGATVNQACAVVQWLPSFQELKGFIRLTLEQQYDAMRERAEGGPQPNLNVGKIKDRLFPMPPLAEQHRIVAKVDELMALCNRLEASLSATAATRRRLLDALLAEALAPAEAREMEAAE
jgi:type I restriction enzyme S subunit